MWQIAKIDIFQIALFSTSDSSASLIQTTS